MSRLFLSRNVEGGNGPAAGGRAPSARPPQVREPSQPSSQMSPVLRNAPMPCACPGLSFCRRSAKTHLADRRLGADCVLSSIAGRATEVLAATHAHSADTRGWGAGCRGVRGRGRGRRSGGGGRELGAGALLGRMGPHGAGRCLHRAQPSLISHARRGGIADASTSPGDSGHMRSRGGGGSAVLGEKARRTRVSRTLWLCDAGGGSGPGAARSALPHARRLCQARGERLWGLRPHVPEAARDGGVWAVAPASPPSSTPRTL
eukprot:COSAG01_NODE_11410_length_1941_cov_2.361021_2_plen_260_part_01